MKFAAVLIPLLYSIISFSQEVDLVRLSYDPSALVSKQTGMAASHDGKYIVFTYEDKTIRVFDVIAGRFIKRFSGPNITLFDIQVTSDRKLALIGKTEIHIWSWKEEKSIAVLPLTYEATKTAFFAPGDLLAVGQNEGNVAIVDLTTNKLVREILYKKHHVAALAFHPSGKKIVVGTMSGAGGLVALKLFDLNSGLELATSDKKDLFTSAAFTKGGDRVVAWGNWGYQILNGHDLRVIRTGDESLRYAKVNMALGMSIIEKRLLMLTDTRAFNVSDLETNGKLFTTTNELSREGYTIKSNFSPGKYGVGSFHIFPLGNRSNRVIINTTKNNINQIFDVQANAMVGYFYTDSNDDFAIVSRDGRVDGTAGAISKLYWTSRSSKKKTFLESTFATGHTPKLLSQLIAENKVDPVFEIDNVLEKIPSIRLKSINAKMGKDSSAFESSQKTLRVEIVAKQNAREITAVTIFQNAKPVKTIANDGKITYTFDVQLTNSFGEENYFYVTASSRSGVDAEKLKFKVAYRGATDAPPRLFLVTIGINSYKNPKYNLNYAQADADGVNQLVNEKSSSVFKEIISYTIRNDSAVKEKILSVLDEIKSRSLEQDMLILYYAGHGIMSEGKAMDKEFFIVPHDVTHLYGKDELLFEKGISANELKAFAHDLNAQKQVFILDACQSSGALDALNSTTRGLAEEKAIAQLARSTGSFWITSTGSDQFASEFDKIGHGIFTYALLEGIQGAADANGDKRLTVRELSIYVEDKVPELSEQFKGAPQYPSAYSFGNDFPLVVYKE